jgi:pyruvate dehydrogenase E2 component (dihydrolipoamide acetyltransferase)
VLQIGEPVVVIVEEKDMVPAFASYSVDDAKSGSGGTGAKATEEPKAEASENPSKGGEAAWPKLEHSIEPAGARDSKDHVAAPRPPRGNGKRVIASPRARKLARDAGVSLEGVSAGGPGGRIVASDIEAAQKAGGGAKPAAGGTAATSADDTGAIFADVDVSNIKKVTARRLLESKTTVPHYYLSLECNVDNLAAMRAQMNKALEKEGGKVSVNDFVIKAAAAALKKVPEVNASWHGDFIRQYENVDVTVAVQTPAGLMVPVVRDADLKGLAAISAEVKELAGKVRAARLRCTGV